MLPAAMPAHDATPPSASRVPATRQPVSFAAGAARVAFVWRCDRWSHEVTLPAGSAGGTGWHSLDGPWPTAGDPRWPASPALVEVTWIEGPGGSSPPAAAGPAILGVGMAGRSHFSASVVRDPLVADAVRFEIACRLHDGPGWIGSTYRQGPLLVRIEAEATGGLPRTVVWSYSLGPDGIFGVRGATVSTMRA
jgi:hypothetical protein